MTKKIIALSIVCMTMTSSVYAVNYPRTTFVYSSQKQVSAPVLSTNNFSVGVTPLNKIAIPSSSSTIADLVFNQSGVSQNVFSLAISNNHYIPKYTNITPGVVSISATGTVSYLSDGTAQINITVGGLTKAIFSPVSSVNNIQTLYGFASTSLASAIDAGGRAAVNGKTPSSTIQTIYSSMNDSNQTYTRNSSLFTGSLDLTAIPAYSSTGPYYNGILVAPDILIMANHIPPSNGETVYFVDNSNITSSRTILSGMEASTSDIYVARLNAPVAAGISFARVFPANLSSYISTTSLSLFSPYPAFWQLPFFVDNQYRTLYVDNGFGLDNELELTQAQFSTYTYYPWGYHLAVGDSGSPVFTEINNQLVAMGTWHNLGVDYSSSNIAYYFNDVNAAMTSLGSSYQLTTPDMSGFASF